MELELKVIREQLKDVALLIGKNIHYISDRLVRTSEGTEEWGKKIEHECETVARNALEDFANKQDYEITLVTMPFISDTTQRGTGKDTIQQIKIGLGKNKVACLYDTVDGTWNEKAGIRFTVSSMMAFTDPLEFTREVYSINDFTVGLIAPHHLEGQYYAIKGIRPRFIHYSTKTDESLNITKQTEPKKIRFFMDLFTAQSPEVHASAVDAVVPVMKEWIDFGRYYGSGVEFMSLFGRSNTEPAYGAYIGAQQKVDNILAPSLLLSQAGAIVSDWNGNSIEDSKLKDRVNIVIAANSILHENLILHLKGKI